MFSNGKRSSPTQRTPPPAQRAPKQTTPSPSLVSTMAEGFAFGTGTSIAREAVSSVLHSSMSAPQPNNNDNDKETLCKNILEKLQFCFEKDVNCDSIFEKYQKLCIE
jgi:hypothetical protein